MLAVGGSNGGQGAGGMHYPNGRVKEESSEISEPG